MTLKERVFIEKIFSTPRRSALGVFGLPIAKEIGRADGDSQLIRGYHPARWFRGARTLKEPETHAGASGSWGKARV